MSEEEPGAQQPEDSGDWTMPVAGPWQLDPHEAGSPQQHWEPAQQHWEPSWPPVSGGSYQGSYPGSWSGSWSAPGYGGGRRRSSVLRQVATVIAVALVAAGAGAGIAYAVAGTASPTSTSASGPTAPTAPAPTNPGIQPPAGSGGQEPLPPSSGGSTTPGTGAPANVAAIAAKVDPALVDINVDFGYAGAGVGGAATGIVLTSTGEVLTNNHVVDGATSISVTDIGNGQTYNATVVGYDSTHDMAVIQLQNASGLQTASFSQSAPTVGEAVVGIGNAGGVGGTPSAAGGSIIGLNQSITATNSIDGTDEQLSGLIETNADIQEGDSGGSLVNADGQVIGMDTAKSTSGFSFQSQAQGTQGFAIPISQVLSTARQIESGHGTSDIHVGPTAFLGVTVSAASPGGGFGNLPGQNSVSGALISGVVNGSAAQAAGLQEGDVITSLGGQTVTSPSDLSQILVPHHPGDSVELGWTDTAGQAHTTTVDLGSGPPE